MAWPTEAGSLGIIVPPLIERRRRRRKAFARVVRGVDPRFLTQPNAPIPKVQRIVRPAIRRRGSRPGAHRQEHNGRGKGAGDRTNIRALQAAILGRIYPTLHHYLIDVLDTYAIFNAAGYRFYFRAAANGPPQETDTPFATNATLPYSPGTTFGDGIYFLAVSYFNGVLDSGFLPVGPNGEPYRRLEVGAGNQLVAPPGTPIDARLILRPGGVVRVQAAYFELGTGRATEWALIATFNGTDPGTPPAVSPTATPTILGSNLTVLEHDLAAQAHGTTVKVRVQVRRNDGGTWRYSEGSTVLTAIADAIGPAAAEGAGVWRGAAPQEI